MRFRPKEIWFVFKFDEFGFTKEEKSKPRSNVRLLTISWNSICLNLFFFQMPCLGKLENFGPLEGEQPIKWAISSNVAKNVLEHHKTTRQSWSNVILVIIIWAWIVSKWFCHICNIKWGFLSHCVKWKKFCVCEPLHTLLHKVCSTFYRFRYDSDDYYLRRQKKSSQFNLFIEIFMSTKLRMIKAMRWLTLKCCSIKSLSASEALAVGCHVLFSIKTASVTALTSIFRNGTSKLDPVIHWDG